MKWDGDSAQEAADLRADQGLPLEPPGRSGNAGPRGPQTDNASDEWCTDRTVASALGQYDLDPCSNARSHVLAFKTVSRPEDGLAIPWKYITCLDDDGNRRFVRRIFVNPPYSDVMPWAKRAIEAAKSGCSIDMLLKLDPTTRWFRALMECDVFADVFVFKRRLKFERPDKAALTANFPSVLICLNSPREPALDGLVWNFGRNGVMSAS